jgi:hypothetical protein
MMRVKMIVVLILIVVLTACKHKYANKIVKDKDGKFYECVPAAIDHKLYFIREVDSTFNSKF